jgi:SAM-dependent methyltransferase
VSDSIARNVRYWTDQAARFEGPGRDAWARPAITWGSFQVPESDVAVLPDVDGADVVELGCGTAYVSAWLARRGARVVAVDPTPAQLATARALQSEHDLAFPLVRAAGESVPLRGASFDVAVSEYGAALWADPYEWVPEAARLLRPGGELVFLTNSLLHVLCAPDEDAPSGRTLQREQHGIHRVEFTDDPGVEYHLAHSDWIRLLRTNGFEVLDLVELYAPPGAPDIDYVTADWAQRWPAEEIWRVRRR